MNNDPTDQNDKEASALQQNALEQKEEGKKIPPPSEHEATPVSPQIRLDNTSKKSITIDGKNYRSTLPESVRECLERGEIIEDCYIPSLSFAVAGVHKEYPLPVVIKNSVIGQIDFGGDVSFQKLHFENVKIEQDLSFHRECLNQPVPLAMTWKNCDFAKSVGVDEVKWGHGLSFIDCKFAGNVKIQNSHFNESLNISDNFYGQGIEIRDSHFKKSVKISHTTSDGSLICTNNTFGENVSASDSHFQDIRLQSCRIAGKMDFSKSKIDKDVQLQQLSCESPGYFADSVFSGKFTAKNCTFNALVSFAKSNFQGCADFSTTQFNGVVFSGSVFQDKALFEKTILTDAHFQGSRFAKGLSFDKAKTHNEFLWQDVVCEGDANFDFVDFNGRASFSDMKFQGAVSFYRATFKTHVWFLGTRFQEASFVNTTFEGQAFFSFDRNTLNERNRRRKQGPREKPLQFVSVFEGLANFTNSVFYRKTVFENVFFTQFANFQNACFAEEIDFEKAHFQKGATFKGSFCSHELNFTQAVFDDYVNFDLANINRRLNLTDAAIDRGISFYHAVIDVVVVERDQIEGRLVYEGKIPEHRDKKHLMRVKEEYLILKESLNQRGKFDEEDWAYYSYRVCDRKSHTDKAWNSLLKRPIIAVQDEVPLEEREDEDQLQRQIEKRIKNHEKKVESLQHRIEKLTKDQEANPSNSKIAEQLKQILKNFEEEKDALKLAERERSDVIHLLEMNNARQQKWSTSKEKAFSFREATGRLLKNALWTIVDWGTGYGVKPFRITLLAIAVILMFAGVYFTYHLAYPTQVVYPNHTISTPVTKKIPDWIYFSAMVFATSSPETDALAYNDHIKFFIMTEALLGLFLMALFVGCYTRKIIR